MKISREQQFYIDVTEKINKELYNLSDKEINKILKLHKNNRDNILNDVGRIILSYNVKDDSLDITSSEQVKLNKEFKDKINNLFKGEIKEEVESINRLLKETAINKYYSNSYAMSLGMDFTLKKITDKQLERIVNNTIEGKVFSERIWSNKNNIANILNLEIKKFLIGETNLNQVEKIIKDKYNSNAYNTKRLVRTETARVMEGANELFAEEHGIEYQLFSATLDNLTSEICQGYDGKIFDFNDSDKPICPLHPNCRSTLISLPSKDYKPNTRLNNITKERIDYKTYEEWKNEQDL
jgi:SPP1 gp7 family putative phage head morphogenesis protein